MDLPSLIFFNTFLVLSFGSVLTFCFALAFAGFGCAILWVQCKEKAHQNAEREQGPLKQQIMWRCLTVHSSHLFPTFAGLFSDVLFVSFARWAERPGDPNCWAFWKVGPAKDDSRILINSYLWWYFYVIVLTWYLHVLAILWVYTSIVKTPIHLWDLDVEQLLPACFCTGCKLQSKAHMRSNARNARQRSESTPCALFTLNPQVLHGRQPPNGWQRWLCSAVSGTGFRRKLLPEPSTFQAFLLRNIFGDLVRCKIIKHIKH